MATEEMVVTIPEDQVQVETFDSDDEKKGKAAFAGTVAGSIGIGVLLTLIGMKIKKGVEKMQMDAYVRRKEREAKIEEELKRREEEQQETSEGDEPLDD